MTSAALLSATSCPSGYTIIQGTNTSNTIVGTSGNDCILGHGGNDTIHGNGGDDVLIGGAGTDTLNGNDGADILYGEDSGDTIDGHAGNDTIYGGLAVDKIFGGDGHDVVYGESGNDVIEGGAGDDRLYGGANQDRMRGGAGRDRLFGEADADDLYGDGDDDIIDGGPSSDDIWGGAGHDVIQGGTHADFISGEDGNDAILGGSGTNTINGGSGSDRCSGTSCELPAPIATACTLDSQCSAPQTCVVEVGVCLPCLADADGDNICDGVDGCSADPGKSAPGVCGCGIADTDTDGDDTADCNDGCASDANKTAPGTCGCGVSDVDSDGDATHDCNDGCASDPSKVEAGVCGCGISDADSDGDATADCYDGCDSDANKTAAGLCGCGVADSDGDGDGVADCNDGCLVDPNKTAPGACGCGVWDDDTDSDGVPDCDDVCEGWDDALDQDHDGVPDACDVECVAGVSGPSVHQGDAVIASAADIAALENIACITGRLTISATALTDLSGFEALRAVVGDLSIASNSSLTSLAGLDNVESVGGVLSIEGNPSLVRLGLASLTSIRPTNVNGALIVRNNEQLSPCWIWLLEEQTDLGCGRRDRAGTAPTDIRCDGNLGTESCGELPPDFVCEPGASGPGVFDGHAAIGGANAGSRLALIASAVCITGDLVIRDTDLTDLVGLEALREVGGNVFIWYNAALTSVDGLSQLTAIGGELYVAFNPVLTDLDGLSSLQSLGGNTGSEAFTISDNPQLPSCWLQRLEEQLSLTCGYLSSPCTGNSGAGDCEDAPPDDCFPGSSGPGIYDDYVFISDSIPEELEGIRCITGDLLILSYSITNLDMLSSLVAVGGSVVIAYNDYLVDVDGLRRLESIGYGLEIDGNPVLSDLSGLSRLRWLGTTEPGSEGLLVTNNPALPECWASVLEGQTGVECGTLWGWPWGSCDGNTGTGVCE